MYHAFNFHDPVEAHNEICDMLVYGDKPGRDYDWVHGTEVGLHNVGIFMETADFEYDLKDIWVLPSRWRKMVRDYINPDALAHTLAMIEDRMSGNFGGRKARGLAVMRTNLIQGRGTGRNVRRRWGSCMLNLTYQAQPVPTIRLHSRTSYFGYLAMMDLAVARTFGKMCAEITGIPLEQHAMVWTLDLAQFHGFRSLAWMLGDDENRRELIDNMEARTDFSHRMAEGNQPGFRKALDGYARILKSDQEGKLYGDEAFSSFCRVRRRYHTEVHGVEYAQQFAGGRRDVGPFDPLPHLMVSTLDFSALGGPAGIDTEDDDDDEE